MNDVPVASSYNFASRSFHTKKLCSRLLLIEVEFYWQKQQNRVLCHPLWDLGVTYTVHLWLLGKRVVNFLLVLIEHFSLALTVEALWVEWILVEIIVFEREWVTLRTNFRGNGRSLTNDCWRQKTRVPELLYGVICVMILRLAILVEHRLVTDRRSHDDGKYRASIASHG